MRNAPWMAGAATIALLLTASSGVLAQSAVVTYLFNNSLAAKQAGKPSLTSVDPLGLNSFGTDTVYGNIRNIFSWSGNSANAEQAGLSLDTTGLVSNSLYSAEFVFKFTERNDAWRRIFDVQNRQSDNGFYVNPTNNLEVFPGSGSSGSFATGAYHHVVLTNAGGVVKAYLNGAQQLSLNTSIMDINNPDDLVNIFLDNTTAGGQGEYSDGSIALFKLYDEELSAVRVRELADDPFRPAAVPEASTLALLGVLLFPAASYLRRRRS